MLKDQHPAGANTKKALDIPNRCETKTPLQNIPICTTSRGNAIIPSEVVPCKALRHINIGTHKENKAKLDHWVLSLRQLSHMRRQSNIVADDFKGHQHQRCSSASFPNITTSTCYTIKCKPYRTFQTNYWFPKILATAISAIEVLGSRLQIQRLKEWTKILNES